MTLHLICDPQFWRVLAIAAIPCAAILGWLVSGKSPCVWFAALFGLLQQGCLHAEAARQQAIDSLRVAARHFAAEYEPRVEQVRREFLEGA